jgi:hypothetical protein
VRHVVLDKFPADPGDAGEADPVFPGALRLVHRVIGRANQVLASVRVIREKTDPDADAHPALTVFNRDGAAHCGADLFGETENPVTRGRENRRGKKDKKFVAPKRATLCAEPAYPLSLFAMPHSRRSPARWDSVSLTALNPSRSRNNRATGRFRSRATESGSRLAVASRCRFSANFS